MDDEKLVPGYEAEDEQRRRHAAEMAALRSRIRRAWVRQWAYFLLAMALLLGGGYVAAHVHVVAGVVMAIAALVPAYAMNGDDGV